MTTHFVALVMLRIHHDIHPDDLLNPETGAAAAESGPVPLATLTQPMGVDYPSLHHAISAGIQKQHLFGWFDQLADSRWEPDNHENQRDSRPSVLHLEPPIAFSLFGRSRQSEQVAFELLPISQSASLGPGTGCTQCSRDAFLGIWISGQALTDRAASNLIKGFTAHWSGVGCGEATDVPHGVSNSLVKSLFAEFRQALGPVGESAHIAARHQTPFLYATLFDPLGSQNAGAQSPSFASQLAQGYRYVDVTTDAHTWGLTGSALTLEGRCTAPGRTYRSQPSARDLRTFFSDGAIAFRLASMQSAQLESFIRSLQDIRPGKEGADGRPTATMELEAQEVLRLQKRYYVFKRRYIWNRVGRLTSANRLLGEMQRDWGINALAEGLDREFRDYSIRAGQDRLEFEKSQLKQERERQDAEETRRRNWQSLAQIISPVLAGLAVVGTWGTLASLDGASRSSTTAWLIAIVFGLMTGGILWLGLTQRPTRLGPGRLLLAAGILTLLIACVAATWAATSRDDSLLWLLAFTLASALGIGALLKRYVTQRNEGERKGDMERMIG